MSIERWRDWFELIALVAVIGSLVAVVLELQQTQAALRAQAYQARAFDGIAWNMEFARDAVIRDIQDQFKDPDFDPNELDPTEWAIAFRLINVVRIDLDNEHYQYQSGYLDPSFYHNETVLRIRKSGPIWRAMGAVSPRTAFREEVDRILAESEQ